MSGSAEEVKTHIKTYWTIGGTLLVLTVVTVAASYLDFAVPLAITVALIIAATKGSLVASYFMHLVGERRGIYATLLLTVFFFLVLMFHPDPRSCGPYRGALDVAQRERAGGRRAR